MLKKKMNTVLITMLALSFVLAVSCGGTPPTGSTVETETTTIGVQPQTTDTTPPPDQTATPVPQRQDIILDGAQSYTVVPGDTLSSISRRSYGSDEYFPIIMLGSSDISDPDRIELDTRLTLPNLQKNLDDPGAKARIKSFFGEVATIYDGRGRPHYADKLRKLADSL